MEKPGMDRGFSPLRSGLLTSIILFFCLFYSVLPLKAQTDGEEPAEPDYLRVEIQTDPEFPELDVPWILTFLVDYPSPPEVSIRYPALPSALSLESIRTGVRIIENTRWTAIEFWFIPQNPGTITLKPFEIITPNNRLFTPVISRYVQGTLREYRPFFSWKTSQASLKIGEPGQLSLYLNNWDPRKPLPSPEQLRRKVPEQAILEEKPLSEADRQQGILLRLEIIPLEGQQFTLEPIRIRHEGLTLEVPGIRIPLIQKEEEPQEKAPVPAPPEMPKTALDASFPEIPVKVFFLFHADYEKALQRIRQLWEEGRIPEALGDLRRSEREELAGPQFALLRREAEQRLGFGIVQDELWRPRKLFILTFLISLGLLIPLSIRVIRNRHFLLPKRKTVTSPGPWGYKGIVIISIGLMILTLFSFREGILYRPESRKTGLVILQAAGAYRVPDEGGGVSAYFSAGQPVIIRSISDSWAYVESFDGRIGWVPRDKVIVY